MDRNRCPISSESAGSHPGNHFHLDPLLPGPLYGRVGQAAGRKARQEINITRSVLGIARREVAIRKFGKIFANCLETLPFLLKRRRYEAEFLDPSSALALELKRFLEKLEEDHWSHLLVRLREMPGIAVKFIEHKATEAHLEKLLRAAADEQEDEESADDE